MWNFTDSGFTSAVEYSPPRKNFNSATKKYEEVVDPLEAQLPEDYYPATDTELSSHLLVRARVEDDLDALAKYDPDAIRFEDKTADYQFRIIVRRTAYADFLYNAAMGIDYNSHVKETINKRAPQVMGGRYGALSAIWSACAKWQPIPPYGGNTAHWNHPTGTVKAVGTAGPKESSDESGSVDYTTPAYIGQYAAELDDREETYMANLLEEYSAIDPDDEDIYPLIFTGESYEGLAVGVEPSRKTMEQQVKDMLREVGEGSDVESVVDDLIERFGTVDLDGGSVPFAEIWDTITKYQINTFVENN